MQASWIQEENKRLTVTMNSHDGKYIKFTLNPRLNNFLSSAGTVSLYFLIDYITDCINECNFETIKVASILAKSQAPVSSQLESQLQTLSIKKADKWLSLGGWIDERDYLKVINIEFSDVPPPQVPQLNNCQFCDKELPLGIIISDTAVVCNYCDKVLKTKKCQNCNYLNVPQNAVICPQCGENPEIIKPKEFKTCINCSNNNLDKDATICNECGKNPNIKAIIKAKKCKNCACQNVAMARFCSNCGQTSFQDIY